MATTIDETSEAARGERAYASLPDGELVPQLRPPIETRYEDELVVPLGPRLRWGGLVAGVVAAFAVILLFTVLGVALGFSTVNTLLLSNNDDIKNFATAAGVWTGATALIAYFVAGLVATKVTDRPDGGALLHGTLTWVLLSMTLSWFVTSGLALGLGGLPGGMLFSMNRDALPVHPNVLTEMDIARRLGLTDPSQLMVPASDERMVNALSATANMSKEEAQTALDDLRARVASAQNDPDAALAEIHVFLSQVLARTQQQAPAVVANSQRQIEIGSRLTLAVMAATLLITVIGARAGIPNSLRRRRLVFRR